jgi:adenine-specific DNA methylase
MAIEANFDVPFIAAMALKEKQIQQNYRPIIAIHKWFARRPGTLFRGLVLSEFSDRPLREAFFHANDFPGRIVADPFMGGGTPLLEANRVGCDVIGLDINPMSAWIVREEIEHLDLKSYRQTSERLIAAIKTDVGNLYLTDCPIHGDRDVPVKYFLWVKVLDCEKCGRPIDLFPGYLVAQNIRHPKNVLVCPTCGELCEVEDRHQPGNCRSCNSALRVSGPAKRNRCPCALCGYVNRYPRPEAGVPRHRMFAIEYYNPRRKNGHFGRFFKKPDSRDLERAATAVASWQDLTPQFVPEHRVPAGDETDRLHRWGYNLYRDLFNARQLLGLELSCRLVAGVADERVRCALATNLSDLLRYQNMLCRYDTMALKSLDIFSVHGFPVGLVQCESNLLGIVNRGGVNVGSGGWANIVEKYARAKAYCTAPFEMQQQGGRKVVVPINGEWIGERLNGSRSRKANIRCASSTTIELARESLDAVLTDPPYFGNVQYAELMDFCYSWLRRLIGVGPDGFDRDSTRSSEELTRNTTQARGIEHFTEGLSAVYTKVTHALKAGAPLAFTFHHNKIEAYYAVGVAVLDAGLTCTATFPCPAEMGGSIHIHGTASSIVDTVFVCRAHGSVRRRHLCESAGDLADLIRGELGQLRLAGLKPTAGDIRCLVFGHLTRIGIWRLRESWDRLKPTNERLQRFARSVAEFGAPRSIIDALTHAHDQTPGSGSLMERPGGDTISTAQANQVA